MRRISYLPLLCMAALLVVPACKFNCSMGGGVDSKDVEKNILAGYHGTAKKVTCPTSIDSTVGAKFECQVEMTDGTAGAAVVTVDEPTDGKFNFTYKAKE